MRKQSFVADDGTTLYTDARLDVIREQLLPLNGKPKKDGGILRTDGTYKLFSYEGLDVLFEGDRRLKVFPV